ncbi:acyltransferase [Pantoea alhagi]|uniref:DapH/DapD/GlmU-related protein n=1 Tax=Pantoea alhagi TaxID=1891675 RepID=UPI00202B3D8F|nr:DapH/DapD/GlmU-related protein [Pantoea alhagi]URQ59609.1 acyltransferase [Pantoea alhagi]
MLFKITWFLRAVLYKMFFFKKIGLISYVGKPIFFTGLKYVRIGKRFRLYPGWRIEVLHSGEIEIEEDVSAGQGLHLISLGSILQIGRGTVISTDVLITNSDHEYCQLDVPIYKQPMINKTTSIGENCFIGAGAKLLAGTKLGKQCIVGANTVIKGHYPDYCVIAGNPAKIVKRFDNDSKQWIHTSAYQSEQA